MAHFNQCSHLIEGAEQAKQAYKQAKNPLQVMLDMQHSLQVKLAQDKPECNVHPDELKTAGQVLAWLRNQKDYIDDETRELYTALGGMSNGEKNASGVWKPWKSNHNELQSKLIEQLSPDDQLEIKFEMVDIMHFVFNMLIALGIDSEELFMLYYLKNKENFNRYNNGY